MTTEKKKQRHTFLPCPAAARVAPAPHWLICPCGSAWKSACGIPGFSILPATQKKHNHSLTNVCLIKNANIDGHADTSPCAAPVSCAERWQFLHEHVGGGCPLSEPSPLCEARLRSLPAARAETCPDECASPTAAIDTQWKKRKEKKKKIRQWKKLY